MLESIREGVQKPWVKIVIFAIIISFVFAGYFTASNFLGDPNAAAVVNGESVSRTEFQRAYNILKTQQADYYNANVKTEEDERNFQENVLQRLITVKVKDQALEGLGMRLSSDMLRQKIQTDPNYQTDGKYSAAKVDQALLNIGTTRSKFKKDYAIKELTEQLLSGVTETDFALPKESQSDYELITQKRTGKVINIDYAKFNQNVELTDEEINQYYEDNKSAFRVEEKVSVDYVELSIDKLQSQQSVTPEELKNYYDENLNRFKAEDQRQVSHILILSNDDEKEALTKAQAIKARIDAGEDFAVIAKNESDDIPTRETGGDLGVLLAGAMEPAFESAANKLEKVGDVSAPVKSDFGYHLIKLTGLTEGSVQSLDDVKADLTQEIKKNKAEEIYYAKAEELTRLAFEVSDSLTEAAAEIGVAVQTSPLFGQSSGEGIFANPDVKIAAFSSDVKDGQINSEPVEIDSNHIVVLRNKTVVPSQFQPLEEVKERVVNDLKRAKAKKAAKDLADQLLVKLEAKESIDDLLTANQLAWKDLDNIERNSASLPYMTNLEFFKMPAPAEGKVSLDKVEGFQGYSILMLNSVKNGLWAEADEALKNQRKLYIGSYFANTGFTAFIEDRRKKSTVKRNLNNLSQ